MKVLMIHAAYRGLGGGEVQLARLRQGLRLFDIHTEVLCRWRGTEPAFEIPRWNGLERWLGKLTQSIGLNDLHCVSSFGIHRHPAYRGADLLDVHCLHSGFFNYLALPKLTAGKPTVFTFHDMWPFTGHCHNSLDCERWMTGCGKCPYPQIAPAVRRDATAWEWKLKQSVYRRSKFHIVTPSKWLFDATKQSILRDFPIHLIPHGIDTNIYRPLEKSICRTALGIPTGKKVLLFAVDNLDRPLKGFDLLIKSLLALPDPLKRDIVLLLLGKNGGVVAKQLSMETIEVGFVASDRLKTIIFSAADLLLHPTRADSFGLVALESMACGTPVVSFRVGGIPDTVRPGISGFLAEPESAEQFSHGIASLLGNDAERKAMSIRCRELAEAEYGLELYGRRYSELYRSVADQVPAKGGLKAGVR